MPTALVSRKRCDGRVARHMRQDARACQQRWSLGSDATRRAREPYRRRGNVPTALVSRKRCDPDHLSEVAQGIGCQQRWSLGSDATVRCHAIAERLRCQQRWSLGSDATWPRRRLQRRLRCANSVGLSEAMRLISFVGETATLSCQQRWSLGSDATAPLFSSL